jgi:hypothetical protein
VYKDLESAVVVGTDSGRLVFGLVALQDHVMAVNQARVHIGSMARL